MRRELPRLAPECDLPPYSFVPEGAWPHPMSDPRGHRFGQATQVPAIVTPANWRDNREYLFGIDLFNHGYYWEAHEVWESLWHAAGRVGPVADFLKGLIKLAAAGVKVRQGISAGVRSHASRAAKLFEQTREPGRHYLGLDVDELVAAARSWADAPPRAEPSSEPVQIVLGLVLRPDD